MHCGTLVGRGWQDLSYWFPKTCYTDRFARFAHLFQDAEALGLELGNGYFLDAVS